MDWVSGWRGWNKPAKANPDTEISVDTFDGGFYARRMEVHFSPEQEAELSHIAAHTGIDTERLVKDAALRLVDETARFRAAVREGVAQADRGELIEDSEVRGWLERQERS